MATIETTTEDREAGCDERRGDGEAAHSGGEEEDKRHCRHAHLHHAQPESRGRHDRTVGAAMVPGHHNYVNSAWPTLARRPDGSCKRFERSRTAKRLDIRL